MVVDPGFYLIHPDDVVVGDGVMATESLRANAEDTFLDKRVWELSVDSLAGQSVTGIALQARLPHGQIRVSTVARIRAAGYDVANRRVDGHCRLPLPAWPSDEDLERLASAFDSPIRNPAPASRRSR